MAERFVLDEVARERQQKGRAYLEFLRIKALSAGLYVLGANAKDLQKPHAEDEIYYVLAGRARFRAGNKDLPVLPGDFLYVPAGESHYFHEIVEELQLLVFFAPAEATV
jgi:mannose-6-phosphate isomerase-like protein (cupin superfamily)